MTHQFKEWVRNYLARVVRWSRISRTTSSGFCGIEGREKDPQEPDYEHSTRLMQHYGIRSRPRRGSECIAVSIGGAASNRTIVATETPGTGPTDQKDGEVELYAQFGQRVILDEDGQITILASGGQVKVDQAGKITIDAKPGADVVVNGGTKPVARVDDTGAGGQLYMLTAQVGPVCTATLLYKAPGELTATTIGSLSFTGTGSPVFPANLRTVIDSGAPHFKA